MKKIIVSATIVMSFTALSAFAESMTGYISDSKCGAKHAEGNAECSAKCIKGGATAVFVSDGKVYKLDDTSKVDAHIGHKVTIDGDVKGDTITVKSVSM
ncbi:MAG: DUF5818 domain-containing protein [Acidobacteriota bacterium]|nr:DUF5818 domain-containing protein [Acidobacteriota bacterium]